MCESRCHAQIWPNFQRCSSAMPKPWDSLGCLGRRLQKHIMAVGTTAESSDDEDESDGDDGDDQEIQAWALADSYEVSSSASGKFAKCSDKAP